jgi:L-amino acid N-acyltransferase YncA
MNKEIKIRLATTKDFDGIWRIFKTVISTGDTYVNRPATTKKEGRAKWFAKGMKTYVALIGNKIVGAYFLRNNHPDLGSHVSNAGFIVDKETRGQGVGKALVTHALDNARNLGYKGMQFNFVVSTNTVAVNLWKSAGFKIIGTVPKGYNHQQLGFVDSYIMYRDL